MKKTPMNTWMLTAYYPHTPVLSHSVEVGNELTSIIPWIPANVPGSIPMDVYRAGWIDDPYKDMNSLYAEWIENKWWMYKKVIPLTNATNTHKTELVFEGLDYKAHVFINDTLVVTHENTVKPCIIDLDDYRALKEITVKVLFEHVPDEMAQIGYTSQVKTQKSRFNYKWDFSTRMVNIGIFGDVYLLEYDSVRLKDTHIKTSVDNTQGILDIRASLTPGQHAKPYHIKTFLNTQLIDTQRLTKTAYHMAKTIDDVQLWWPNGYGEQSLYTVTITIDDGTTTVWEETHKIGFKTVKLIANDHASDNALPYTFLVNGRKMYVKGMNITPLDVYLGEIPHDKYNDLLDLLVDANINLVRVWGGGVIENTHFYTLCDQKGLLIWQEFMQSSSGLDNIPTKSPAFLSLLKDTSIAAIKRCRNHVSLAVWSGGNELTDGDGVPSTIDDDNLSLLYRLVNQYDPNRPMYPTSGSGPNAFGNLEEKGLNHDVHGHWKYLGEKDHYTYFNTIDSLFHSEFGVDGMTSKSSMQRFLSPQHVGPYDMDSNIVWRHHGEWWDTKQRDEAVFGKLDQLDDRILASQFLQYEGLRYALEANRRRAFHNSGSIIWQANEPYPNVSCTSLIDYYLYPKPALNAVKHAFAPMNPNLKYDALVYDAGDTITCDVYITTDIPIDACRLEVHIHNEPTHTPLVTKTYKASALTEGSHQQGTLSVKVPQGAHAVKASLKLITENAEYDNHVLWLVRTNGYCRLDSVSSILNYNTNTKDLGKKKKVGEVYEN